MPKRMEWQAPLQTFTAVDNVAQKASSLLDVDFVDPLPSRPSLATPEGQHEGGEETTAATTSRKRSYSGWGYKKSKRAIIVSLCVLFLVFIVMLVNMLTQFILSVIDSEVFLQYVLKFMQHFPETGNVTMSELKETIGRH